MPDPASYVAVLTVLGGPYKGRNFYFQEAVDDVLIGSDPDCHLILDSPDVSPLHARIWLEAGGATVYDTRSARGVYVNDERVMDQTALKDGDFVWLGPPGDADSVLLQFRHQLPERPPAMVGDDEWAIAEPFPEEAEPPADEPLGELLDTEFLLEESRASLAADSGEAAFEIDEFVVEDEQKPGTLPTEFVLEPPQVASRPAPQPPPATPPMAAAPAHHVPPAAPVAVTPHAVPVAGVPQAPSVPQAPAPLDTPGRPGFGEVGPAGAAARIPAAAVPPGRLQDDATLPPAPLRPEGRPRPPAPRAAPTQRPGQRAAPPKGRNLVKWLVPGVGVLLALGVGGYSLSGYLATPRIENVSPERVAPGDKVTVVGRNFSPEAGRNAVRFGPKEGRLLKASATQLEAEVPELPTPVGHPSPVPIVVRVDGRDSKAVSLVLYRAPRVHGIAPSVAMPGEEIALAGSGWAPGAKVTIGGHPAEILELTPTSLRVRVPVVSEPVGMSLPVIVVMGDVASNQAPFLLGRLPLITGVEPGLAAEGDVVVVKGRGFDRAPASNDLRIGGHRALVVSANDDELKAVVPRIGGEGATVALELKVPASQHVATTQLNRGPSPAAVDFRFVAEPWDDAPGHDHAALATDLGPVLVLSAAGGRRAAERALQAQERLNRAAGALKATLAADLELRLGGSPAIGLVGKDESLLEVADEDAAAYENEDWTKLKGKGGPVTKSRLALWWSATIRDLVLLLLRSEKPRHALALAPEARVLGDLYDAARKTGSPGLPREVLVKAPPRFLDGLRLLALRVPPTVKEPLPSPQAATGAAEPQRLEGIWSGFQTDEGERMSITITFAGEGGTLTYERTLTLTLPILKVERQKDTVRFSLQSGERLLRYVGTLQVESMKGKILSEAAGGAEIGIFELERKR